MKWETADDRIEKAERFMMAVDRWSTILGYVAIVAAPFFIILPALLRIWWR